MYIIFNNKRYITKGVSESIPEYIQNILWYAIDTMSVETKDYLQVFELSEFIKDDKRKQKIVHSQEQPKYSEEYFITNKKIISEKIYVINDCTYSTMLLASEY